jgi:hypothetical protein
MPSGTLLQTTTLKQFLLELMREKEWSVDELAVAAGAERTAVSHWVNHAPVSPSSMRHIFGIARSAGLSDPSRHNELAHMVKLYDPGLDISGHENAFVRTEGEIAFDRPWLATQPSYRRFGLYLEACRNRKNHKLKGAADSVGISAPAQEYYEQSKRLPRDPDTIERMKAYYADVKDFDAAYFQQLFLESRAGWPERPKHLPPDERLVG